jgi:hypothetical protein
MVPGRVHKQCRARWLDVLEPTIDHTTGKWTPEEGQSWKFGNDTIATAELVSGRTSTAQ